MDKKSRIGKILFLGLACFAIVMAATLVPVYFHPQSMDAIIVGLAVGVVFNLSGLWIRMAAVGKDTKKFFVYTFVIWPLNAILFLGVIAFVIRKFQLNIFEFVCAIFIAYFALMIYDIFKLRDLQFKT